MRKFLYAHPEESIAYIIDKISETPEDDIFLVVDASQEVFSDPLNLKLLKRESDNFSKKITIVSKAPNILDASAQAGFSTSSDDIDAENKAPAAGEVMREAEAPIFAPPQSSDNELPWMRKKTAEEVLEMKDEDVQEEREFETLMKSDAKAKPSARFLSWKFITAAIGIAALAAVAGFYALSPRVVLNVITKKATFNIDFKVVADTAAAAVDVKSGKVPGQLIKLEKEISDRFSASGKKDSESKAEGEITIYNEFGASSQRLVKNTRFAAKDNMIFRLKSDVTVPGATMAGGKVTAPGIITAAVVADQPGPRYNIGPADFTVPGFEGTPKFIAFYGKSSNSMSGGALSGVAFVTKEDSDAAKASLIDKFNKSVEELSGTETPQGMKSLPRSRLEPTFDFSVDEPGQDGKFTAKLKAGYGVFVFSENDISQLIDQYLAGKFSEDQKPDPASRAITYSDESLGANNLSLSFAVKVSQLVKSDIDEAAIKNNLAGKNEEEMKDVLRANEAIESAEFSFWPIWISVAPRDPGKIKIMIQE